MCLAKNIHLPRLCASKGGRGTHAGEGRQSLGWASLLPEESGCILTSALKCRSGGRGTVATTDFGDRSHTLRRAGRKAGWRRVPEGLVSPSLSF